MDAVAPLVLLFALAGGYSFSVACHWTRFRLEALEWERNFFEAAIYGLVLFASVEAFAVPFIIKYYPSLAEAWSSVRVHIPFPHFGALVLSVAGGALIGGTINLFLPTDEAMRLLVDDYGGELLVLLHFAARNGYPVSLTMSNRKVYVGFVLATPTLRYPYTSILPTKSGYRDEKTLNVEFDTPYARVRASLKERRETGELVIDDELFGIMLPIDQICSANIFDEGVYQRYFEEAHQKSKPVKKKR